MADKIRITAALILVAAGVAGFYLLDQSPMIVRVASVLAGLAAGAGGFWTAGPGKQVPLFGPGSVGGTQEGGRATREETVQTTGVVFAFMVVMALFLWVVDAGLLWAVKRLLGQS